MKRRIFNLILLLIFFVSTTGLPITVYLCNMDMETVCETMDKDMMQHCENDKTAPDHNYKLDSRCCEVKTISATINDYFISSNSELKVKLTAIHLQSLLTTSDYKLNHELNHNLLIGFIDSSPPGIHENIYLNNSILLI